MAKGKALRLSEEEINREAEITPEDIRVAVEWWREEITPRYKNLLDATPTEEGSLGNE